MVQGAIIQQQEEVKIEEVKVEVTDISLTAPVVQEEAAPVKKEEGPKEQLKVVDNP